MQSIELKESKDSKGSKDTKAERYKRLNCNMEKTYNQVKRHDMNPRIRSDSLFYGIAGRPRTGDEIAQVRLKQRTKFNTDFYKVPGDQIRLFDEDSGVYLA